MSRTTFISSFLENPKAIGSFVPSSSFLARKMIHFSGIHQASCVLEFWAGTGVITKEILRAKPQDCELYAFELEHKFLPHLNEFHSQTCHIIADDVRKSSHYVPYHSVDVIFSCLPFGSFPNDLVDEILAEAKKMLKPGGKFIQFQYFLSDRKAISRHFHISHIGWEWRNFPPAFVYVATNEK